ncbi:ACR3 family arsenite efflux transporter, partial [Sphingomonas sp. UBA4815]|uniref:ACR3 family arsenite efflux transporter n=1 Tax=Sphingomonas sp. UBA4815 TaxID=1947533 RepID=UPI0031F4F593
MSPTTPISAPEPARSGIGTFERYLTLWVLLCILAGIGLGHLLPGLFGAIAAAEVARVNLVVAVLIWLMIIPMMMKVDFGAVREVGRRPRGLFVTLFVNWLVKPFSMAFFAWVFFRYVFAAWIPPADADQYIAGCIILAAAPCTAMVFVWSYLADGDPAYTLVQVAVNDLIMLVAFVPIVSGLLGISGIPVPWDTLALSVVLFVVVPLTAGWFTRRGLIRRHGLDWFERSFLPKFGPITIVALLTTLVLIFIFQGEIIVSNPLHILLIAVPLSIQTFLIFGI